MASHSAQDVRGVVAAAFLGARLHELQAFLGLAAARVDGVARVVFVHPGLVVAAVFLAEGLGLGVVGQLGGLVAGVVFHHRFDRGLAGGGAVGVGAAGGHGLGVYRLHAGGAQLGVLGVAPQGQVAPFVFAEGNPGRAAFFRLFDDQVVQPAIAVAGGAANHAFPGRFRRLGRGLFQQDAVFGDAIAFP